MPPAHHPTGISNDFEPTANHHVFHSFTHGDSTDFAPVSCSEKRVFEHCSRSLRPVGARVKSVGPTPSLSFLISIYS
jgi:hypothetical protein